MKKIQFGFKHQKRQIKMCAVFGGNWHNKL